MLLQLVYLRDVGQDDHGAAGGTLPPDGCADQPQEPNFPLSGTI
jgi:hypothetical protein